MNNASFNKGKFDMEAAFKSAISKGAVNSLNYIQQVANGEINEDEAIENIVEEIKTGAIESLTNAFCNRGESDLIVEAGKNNPAIPLLAGQGVKNTLAANAIAGGVSFAFEAARDLVKLGTGEITADECLERQGKNVLTTAEGIIGASVGGTGGVAIASSLGIGAGTTGTAVATVAGGLAGGLIAGLAMTIAIENGVEKPYRDLVRNTEKLQDAEAELVRLSETMCKGQIVFGKFLEADYALEKEFQAQMKNINEAGKRAMENIRKV